VYTAPTEERDRERRPGEIGLVVLREEHHTGTGLVLDGGRSTSTKNFAIGATVSDPRFGFFAVDHVQDDGSNIGLGVVKREKEARKFDYLSRFGVDRAIKFL
jgi:hypothetical protein